MTHRAAVRVDRGDATAQLVILVPVVLFLLLMAVQVTVYFHAAHVASVAAAEGAAAGAAFRAPPQAAASAAHRMVDDLGGELARPPAAQHGATAVRVTVTLRVAEIVPFFPRTVSRSADEPRERYTTEAER
jgi:hypothetical protein